MRSAARNPNNSSAGLQDSSREEEELATRGTCNCLFSAYMEIWGLNLSVEAWKSSYGGVELHSVPLKIPPNSTRLVFKRRLGRQGGKLQAALQWSTTVECSASAHSPARSPDWQKRVLLRVESSATRQCMMTCASNRAPKRPIASEALI